MLRADERGLERLLALMSSLSLDARVVGALGLGNCSSRSSRPCLPRLAPRTRQPLAEGRPARATTAE